MAYEIRWKYKVDEISDYEPEYSLNKIGTQGWELVSVISHGTSKRYFFKKRYKVWVEDDEITK